MGADPLRGWGRPPSQVSGEQTDPTCGPTGVMATACLYREIGRNTGDPSGGCVSQPDAREGQAGPCGESERSIVPLKPGNSGGGKGPYFGCAVEVAKSQETLTTGSTNSANG